MASYDFGVSGRKNTFEVCRVDPYSLSERGSTLEIPADLGSMTIASDADNFYSATLNLLEPPGRDSLLRVKMLIDLPDAPNHYVTLGTFFVDQVRETHKYGCPTYTASCYSTMMRFSKDVLFGALSWNVGDKVVDAIRYLVENHGGKFNVMPGNNMLRTFSVPIYWPDNTKLIDVITDMAYWINCRVYTDVFGYVVMAPYLPPKERALAYAFEEGRHCTYKAGYSIEDMSHDSYNRFKVYFSNNDGSAMATRVLPPTHPFSVQRIGRWATYSEQISNPCSQADLEALAQRRMDENSANYQYIVIEHAFVPDFDVFDKVQYINTVDGQNPINQMCEVVQTEIKLDKTAMCTTKLRILE